MISKIFLKELKDTLRDKRTLLMMIVVPVLIFPLILNLFVTVSASFEEEAANKEVTIGFVGDIDSKVLSSMMNMPESLGKMNLKPYVNADSMKQDVRNDSIQLAIQLPENVIALERNMQSVTCQVYFNATDVGIKDRAEVYMNYVIEKATKERYAKLELDEQSLTPIVADYQNLASSKEMIGKLAGGLLPYIFIAFGFIGCMYPAIDLFTGEKERGTIETLLTTPVARWQLLFGKMGVVVLSGLLAATSALVGLFLSIEVMDIVENEQILKIVHEILSPGFIGMLFLLLFPLTIFFAGVMIPIAIYAKSFKEAQSIITPLNIVMVLPALVGFFPGIELNTTTALIPVINVVLATKELIAGTLEPSLLMMAFGMMVLIALAAVLVSYKRFDKETNIVM